MRRREFIAGLGSAAAWTINQEVSKVIHLHAFAPLWGLVDISPFVTKVDVYLRLTKLPYKLVPFSMESFASAPKGKLPYIVDGEERVADSNFIIDHSRKITAIRWMPTSIRPSGPQGTQSSGCSKRISTG